jgi:flavin-dependent dehydrogenase
LLKQAHPCWLRGSDVTWRAATQTAGPGYLIAGDAAVVLDPASSHGVLRAVMSGIYAGHVVGRILREPQSETVAILEFSQWTTGWFNRDVAQLSREYDELFPGWRKSASVLSSAPRLPF